MKQLSGRELEVLRLIAQGHSNAAICSVLWVSRKTVESHISNIYRKLDLPPEDRQHRRVMAALAYLGTRAPQDIAA